jgi:prepilin-type N-terminal cleavage/methylation domain-containing protein
MKTSQTKSSGVCGFTLIELLVVIAIIGVLAALLLPVGAKIKQNSTKKRVQAELNKVVLGIDSFKTKLGHYPPDNPNNIAVNPLYFELLGVKQVGPQFQTLAGSGVIDGGNIAAFYGAGPNTPVAGFVNAGASSDDSSSAAASYLTELVPAQYMSVGNNGVQGAVLGTTVEGPLMLTEWNGTKRINPFRYNSSNPTNNINSFDLWVDIYIGKTIFRISNWSDPIPNP